MSTYADFKRRYASLPTEELLRIQATADLVPEAGLAMKSELAARRLEIEREKYEVYIAPPVPPPRHFGVWLHVGLFLLTLFSAFVVWAWDALSQWLRG